jgi:hypothetical protein
MSLHVAYAPPPRAPVLPRNEMAFRKRYRGFLVDRSLTTVFRPGCRIFPNWRGYREGEVVSARIISRVGSDELGIPPEFDDFRRPIRIESLRHCALDLLDDDAFCGSSPDVFDRESLVVHLGAIYPAPLEAFGNCITRIGFSYA